LKKLVDSISRASLKTMRSKVGAVSCK